MMIMSATLAAAIATPALWRCVNQHHVYTVTRSFENISQQRQNGGSNLRLF